MLTFAYNSKHHCVQAELNSRPLHPTETDPVTKVKSTSVWVWRAKWHQLIHLHNTSLCNSWWISFFFFFSFLLTAFSWICPTWMKYLKVTFFFLLDQLILFLSARASFNVIQIWLSTVKRTARSDLLWQGSLYCICGLQRSFKGRDSIHIIRPWRQILDMSLVLVHEIEILLNNSRSQLISKYTLFTATSKC